MMSTKKSSENESPSGGETPTSRSPKRSTSGRQGWKKKTRGRNRRARDTWNIGRYIHGISSPSRDASIPTWPDLPDSYSSGSKAEVKRKVLNQLNRLATIIYMEMSREEDDE